MGLILVVVFLIRVSIAAISWLCSHWYFIVVVAGLITWANMRSRRIKSERQRREQARIDEESREREQKQQEYLDMIAASGIEEIDSWSDDKGTKFEDRMAVHFEYFGCTVRKTKLSGDFGADLIVHNPITRKSCAIQCKCYNPKRTVGVSAVQEALSGMHHYKTNHAMVITNSRLTKNARQLAQSSDVHVWERDELIRQLAKEHDKRQEDSMARVIPHLIPDMEPE